MRVTDTDAQPGKPKIFSVTCTSQSMNKAGQWKISWKKTVHYDGYEEFAKKYPDLA